MSVSIGHTMHWNGWTSSVIETGENTYEAWSWDAQGDAPDDPRGWLSAEEASTYVKEVSERPTSTRRDRSS